MSLSSSYLLIVYLGFPALGFPGNTLKMQILGCDVVQWVKDLSHKHEDLNLNSQNPYKSQVQ